MSTIAPTPTARGPSYRMEHRWSNRLPVRLLVRICRGTGQPLECYTDNVSLEGAFLRADTQNPPPDLRLRAGTPLAVEFTLHDTHRHQPERFELSGIVMHRGPEGAGVMFCAPAPELLEAIRAQAATDEVVATSTPRAPQTDAM